MSKHSDYTGNISLSTRITVASFPVIWGCVSYGLYCDQSYEFPDMKISVATTIMFGLFITFIIVFLLSAFINIVIKGEEFP